MTTYTIKPLEWSDAPLEGGEVVALAAGYIFAIGYREPLAEWVALVRYGVASSHLGLYPTLEAAIAACEADYRARLLPALVPVEVPLDP